MYNNRTITIAIDFDGTCVTHAFPEIGHDIGAVPVLKELVANGHRLILFTMRSNIDKASSNNPNIQALPGNHLSQALRWFNKHGIPLFGINTNPYQHTWTSSPMAFADLYIDDLSLGTPMKINTKLSDKAFVDWDGVKIYLRKMGLIY